MVNASVIIYPGSNCDRDMITALKGLGARVTPVWHRDSSLPGGTDLVVLPGGFSYGDYLRSGAMAARSPITDEVVKFAGDGGHVFGVCNGFQVLTEVGLLPGALMRNKALDFICRDVYITDGEGGVSNIPIAHHDGCYYIDEDGRKQLRDEGRVAFFYSDEGGNVTDSANPNGSVDNIAGVRNKGGNVIGMMPHPERAWEAATGGTDGAALLSGLLRQAA